MLDLLNGDCLELMRDMDSNSVDSIVTDPPYEFGMMGKKWDATGIANNPAVWTECLRVLRPGGYLLAFSGARTYHRMVCAIEDAGFEVRDQIMWLYGQGWPKSRQQLKPAHEPIVMAKKAGKSVLNIDACRVEGEAPKPFGNPTACEGYRMHKRAEEWTPNAEGRWPANVIHSHDVAALLGDAARFFYNAKATKEDRGEGNNHPTVKPLRLMQHLCRLVTPAGGVILDPFMGSGSTGKAALVENFRFVGIEKDAEYFQIATDRLRAAHPQTADGVTEEFYARA